jgi:Tfp pilus assembly protein PilF
MPRKDELTSSAGAARPESPGDDADHAASPDAESKLEGADQITSCRERSTSLALESRFAEAEVAAREGLQLCPEEVDMLNALAVAVWRQRRAAEAEEIFRRAISIKPDAAYIWTNLGLFHAEQKRHAEAAESFRTVLEHQPDAFLAQMNLGIALSEQGQFDEASHCLLAALTLEPKSPAALQNIGMNLSRQTRWAEAVEFYERAAQIEPNNPDPQTMLGCVLIGAGDFVRGWAAYEWRLSRPEHKGARINRTFWNGDDFRDQTILLHYEQGYGDTLQFIRFAPLVKRRGGRVILMCQTPLVRLLSRCPGIDMVCDGAGYEPPCHIHAPLMSLPSILGTTLATLPANVPYLFAESALIEHWRTELNQALGNEDSKFIEGPGRRHDGRRFLVGVAWQGHPEHQGDRWRSFSVDEFAPVARVPGVRLVSLQVSAGREQVEALHGRFAVIDLSRRRGRDFSETAALMCSLDLVITPDTAVAHLAGGLGIPVWLALPYASEWRWLSDRDHSPWYPTMRLFRQNNFGDWAPVFERMAEALGDLLGREFNSRSEDAA